MPKKKESTAVDLSNLWDTPTPLPPRTGVEPKPPRRRPKLSRKPRTAKASRKALADNQVVEVILTRQHSINAVNYGPGRIKLPKKLADVLMEQETRARHSEDIFQSRDRAFMIRHGRGGTPFAQQVSAESFDTSYATAVPFGTISGKQFPQQ